jgi:DNA repair protein RecN (Recombination protein N)
MLAFLRISNFALIDYIELEFKKGFTVITGETGSGKSILLGALDLILGERADFTVIGPDSSKCFVEAEFQIAETFQSFFEENDIDFNATTLIRREINVQGKSRAFINDTPVSLQVLRGLASQLVNIHSQYNTLELKDKSYQLDMLDCLAGIKNDKTAYLGLFHQWKSKQQLQLDQQEKYEERLKWLDYNQFQLNELAELNLGQIDFSLIENELHTLENSESLKSNFYHLAQTIHAESGIYSSLISLKSALDRNNVSNVNLNELKDRLASIIPELKDIGEEAENFADNLEMNPDKIVQLTGHLDAFNRLLSKHQKQSQEELKVLMIELTNSVDDTDLMREELENLNRDVEQAHDELIIRAGILHNNRLNAVGPISKSIQVILTELKMPDTLLLFQLTQSENLTVSGNTEIQLLFSANKGITPISIEKAASGGELSRVMLALQKLISEKRQLPTILFDEIDTGVSGEVAHKIASLLGSMSNESQLFAITHLPQVAAKANHNAKVEKMQKGDRTISKVEWLNGEDKVTEIARLMSGEIITPAAIENARNLILH